VVTEHFLSSIPATPTQSATLKADVDCVMLTDSLKSFYMHNQQCKCTDIVLELEIDLKMVINVQFPFFSITQYIEGL